MESHNQPALTWSLPFSSQLQAIDELLDEPLRLCTMLKELGQWPDHEPLSYAWRGAVVRGYLEQKTFQEVFVSTLASLPDTGVQRLLRGMEQVAVSEAQWQRLAALTLGVLRQWPMARLSVICFVDRWLKHVAPLLRTEWIDGIVRDVKESVSSGVLSTIREEELLHIPGAILPEIHELATQTGCLEEWEQSLASFAAHVLQILQSAPRSLSQANAEELLAKRVYTDPGHFLVELFQNAEDAKASTFSVTMTDDAVWIRHDGIPFDAKDVVGILSIGQTTKAREQIGFFGVGFKSVYEVCERPQIYSDVFSFEIADVSIPRPLLSPASRKYGETLLCLPFRPSRRQEHQPSRMYAKALAVPPETLLTLRHLTTFHVAYGEQQRTITLHRQPGTPIVSLFHHETQTHQRYLTHAGHFVYQREQRELSRATETTALIAIRLGPDGTAEPLPADAPTLFSHLPTEERSGLRFLLHAHFDLPVDRERLQLSSDWNRWALALAGTLLVRVCELLAAYVTADANTQQTWEGIPDVDALRLSVFDILPLSRELHHPALEGMIASLCDAAPTLPVVPMADGGWITPNLAYWFSEPALVPILADVSLSSEGHRAAAFLTDRRRDVIEMLGVSPFTADHLLALLEQHLAEHVPGTPWPTEWLLKGHAAILSALGTMWETASPKEPIGWKERLGRLPLFPDQSGMPCLAGDIYLASPTIQALYGPHRSFLHREVALGHTSGHAFLCQSMALPTLSLDAVLDDLRSDTLRAQLLAHAGAEAWLSFAARQERVWWQQFSRLPVFPIHGMPGAYGSIHPKAEAPLWLAPDHELFAWLSALTSVTLQFVDQVTGESHRPWLLSMGAVPLDFGVLLGMIEEGSIVLTCDEALSLHQYINAHADELTTRQRQRLVHLPLFPDTEGVLRPLVGEDCTHIPEDEQTRHLVRGVPWLSPACASLSYLPMLPFEVITTRTILRWLCDDSSAFVLTLWESDGWRPLYRYLTSRHQTLSPRELMPLIEAPVWCDVEGTPQTLAQLLGPSEDVELAALLGVFDARFVIQHEDEDAAWLAVQALGLQSHVAIPDASLLVERLAVVATDGIEDDSLRKEVLSVLSRKADELSLATLGPLLSLPLFASATGEVWPLASWGTLTEDRVYRPGERFREVLSHVGVALLAPEEERDFAPLLDAFQVPKASWFTLLQIAERASFSQSAGWHGYAEAFRRVWLCDERTLPTDRDFFSRVGKLPLWPTKAGEWSSAERCMLREAREAAVGETLSLVWQAHSARCLLPEVEAEASQFARFLQFAEPIDVFVAHLQAVLQPGVALDAQPAPFGQRASLHEVLQRLLDAGQYEVLSTLPLVLDHRGTLRTGPLRLWPKKYMALLEGLPVETDAMCPDWWEEMRECLEEAGEERGTSRLAQWGEPLKPSRWLMELRRAQQRGEPSCLDTAEGRALMYEYMISQWPLWESQPQLLESVGQLPCLRVETGVLRTPKECVWGKEAAFLASMGLGEWCCSDEVPAALQLLCQQQFALEEDAIDDLIRILADAHRQIQATSDVERSVALWKAMARVASGDAQALNALARKHKLLRLRVTDTSGAVVRLGTVIMVSAEQRELLERCLISMPVSVDTRYDTPDIRALWDAIDVPNAPPTEQLLRWLTNESLLQEGEDASLAWAQYLALLACQTPKLIPALALHERAWIPDGFGERKTPQSLYWPLPAIEELLGRPKASFPHPMVFHTVPMEICERLPFLRYKDVTWQQVTEHLMTMEEGASVPILEWLEAQLRKKLLSTKEVLDVFASRPLLRDEAGTLCFPSELICTAAVDLLGEHKRVWKEGLRYSKLASVLGISHRVRAADVYEVGEEIQRARQATDARTLLAERPFLYEQLPYCLAFLAEANATPAPFPLLVSATDGRYDIRRWDDPAVVRPTASRLVEQWQDEEQTILWFPVYPSGKEDVCDQWLAMCGVPSFAKVTNKAKQSVPAVAEEAPRRNVPREPVDSSEGKGLWGTFREWWKGEESTEKEERPAPQKQATSKQVTSGRKRQERSFDELTKQDHWFRPQGGIEEQLSKKRDGWNEQRGIKPVFGFGFLPYPLPEPHLYAPQSFSGQFSVKTQRWSASQVPVAWRQSGGDEWMRVNVSGHIPMGENLFPLPLYSRVEGLSGEHARVVQTRQGTTLLVAKRATDVSCSLVLETPPDVDVEGVVEAPPSIATSFVPDRELPDEVLDWVAVLDDEPMSMWDKAHAIRDMIRTRYVYDPSYLEDPAVARWLSRVVMGSQHRHITALHAGADNTHLGRGVCYEFGMLACELLRRVGIPAVVSQGWTWDHEGQVTEPDHMWAMALLPSSLGPRWWPIDASTTLEGRPLRAGRRPYGTWDVKPPTQPKKAPKPKQPAKQTRRSETQSREADHAMSSRRTPRHSEARRPSVSMPPSSASSSSRDTKRHGKQRKVPVAELMRVIRHLQHVSDREQTPSQELQRECKQLLQDPDTAKALLKLLGKD
jgi:transglutaminase-like putative cysteine protease